LRALLRRDRFSVQPMAMSVTVNGQACSLEDAVAPSQARCFKARSRSAPGPTGTTRCLDSSIDLVSHEGKTGLIDLLEQSRLGNTTIPRQAIRVPLRVSTRGRVRRFWLDTA
jgi:hypothetical protein